MADQSTDTGDYPSDRLAARSLAASDRGVNPAPAPQRRSFLPWILTTAAVAFSLGLVANPWFETSVRSRLPGQFQHPAAAPDPRVDALQKRVMVLESEKSGFNASQGLPVASLPADAGLQIAALETEAARLAAADAGLAARLDQMAAAAGKSTANQAEMKELFLLSVARRFVQAGRPFGGLQRPFIEMFAPRDPAATDALVAWSAAPHSRDTLEYRLKSPVKRPVPPPVEAGWWDRLVFRLSDVVQVRGDGARGAGDTNQQTVLEALQADDLAKAIATMELSPATPERDLWLADAMRLQAAEQALESLEMQLLASPLAASPPESGAAFPPVNAPQANQPVPADTAVASSL